MGQHQALAFGEHFLVVVLTEPVIQVDQVFRSVHVPDSLPAVGAFQEQQFNDRVRWVEYLNTHYASCNS
jgi:hypothetical protein